MSTGFSQVEGMLCLHITCQLYSGSQAQSLAQRTFPFSLAGRILFISPVQSSCAQDSVILISEVDP